MAASFFLFWMFFWSEQSKGDSDRSEASKISDLTGEARLSNPDSLETDLPGDRDNQSPRSTKLESPNASLIGTMHAPDGGEVKIEGVDLSLFSISRAVDLGIRTFPGIDPSMLHPAVMQVRSSRGGEFQFVGLVPGEYGLLVWTPNFLPIEKHILIEPGENKLELSVVGAGLRILGKTIGEDQKPIEDVQLIAVRGIYDRSEFDSLSDWEKLRLQMFSEVERSEVSGDFTLRGLSPGLFDIYAIKEGYAQQSRHRVEAGSEGLVFVMTRAAKLAGIVRDESGSPIPKPRLAAQNYFGAGNFGDSGQTEGDENGLFELPTVKTGGISVDLFAEADGYARVQLPQPPLKEGEQRVVDVTLPKATTTAGRILDQNSKPVQGVQVFFGDGGKIAYGNLKPIHSDARGEFSISSMQSGKSYFLYLVKEGYEPKLCQPIAGGSRDLTLVLKKYFSLAGRLLAEDGAKAFPAFTAETFSEDEHAVRQLHQRQDFPAGSGEFQLAQISPSSNGLQVWVPGYAPAVLFDLQGQIRQVDGKPTLEVPLRRGKSAKGRVVDAKTRSGISGARVMVASQTRLGQPQSGGQISAETESDGSFFLEGLEAGISIQAQGYATHVRSLSTGENRKQIDLGEIPLRQSGSILVNARYADGAPISGMEIEYAVRGIARVPSGFTDAAGQLLLENLEPGQYQISAWDWKSTFESGRPYAHSKWIEVKEGVESKAVFDMRGGGSVVGRVAWGKIEDPFSWPEAAVFLVPAQSANDPQANDSAYWAKVNGLGEYWIPNVPRGRYLATLMSFYLPQRYALSREVFVDEGRESRLDFAALPSGLAGQILEAQSGKPLGNARIQVIPSNGVGEQTQIYSFTDGAFGVIGLRAGSYRLRVSKEGFAAEEFGPFEVSADRVTEGIRVHLIPQGLLQILAAGKSGSTLSGAKISLPSVNRELISDAQGSVTFDQLKPGPYQVEIQAAGYAKKIAGPATVEAGKQQSLHVYLRRLCKLSIQVQGPNGAAAPPGTTLSLLDQETGETWPTSPTLSDGVATISDLPEGSWKIVASVGASSGSVVVEVLPDQANATVVGLP